MHATLTQLQSQGTKANHRLADAPAVLDLLKLDCRLSLSQLAIPLAWLEAKDMIVLSLQCASMFLLIFDTLNKSETRFGIYPKTVSLQNGNENSVIIEIFQLLLHRFTESQNHYHRITRSSSPTQP